MVECEWLNDGDVVITEGQMKYFEELITMKSKIETMIKEIEKRQNYFKEKGIENCDILDAYDNLKYYNQLEVLRKLLE